MVRHLIHLQKKLELSLGARYDYEHKMQSVYQENEFTKVVQVSRPDTSSSANFKAFSPKVSLAFHPLSASTLYANYSKGFRAGGLQNDADAALYVFNPEKSNNFEIGYKNILWDNRILFNITAFYVNINDAQTPTLILPQALTITKNAGKVTSKGVEVEFFAKPVKGLQIEYNFGYNDAKYKTLRLPNGNSSGEENFDGNQQIFTPSHTSMLALQYSYDLGSPQQLQLVGRMEWRSMGKQYFDLPNTISQSPYHILNARAGVSARNFEVMLWGRNLSDEKYIEYAYSFGGAHLGNPFNYGVTVSGRF